MDPRVLRDGVARPPRPRRFLGQVPAILSAYDPTKPDGLWGGSSGTLWTFRTYMVIAAIGTVLAAGYLLWMFQKVAFGKVNEAFEQLHVHDVAGPEWIAWTPLLALIVALGIYPSLVFKLADPPGHAHRQRNVEGHLGESHRRPPRDHARDRPHRGHLDRARGRSRLARAVTVDVVAHRVNRPRSRH